MFRAFQTELSFFELKFWKNIFLEFIQNVHLMLIQKRKYQLNLNFDVSLIKCEHFVVVVCFVVLFYFSEMVIL